MKALLILMFMFGSGMVCCTAYTVGDTMKVCKDDCTGWGEGCIQCACFPGDSTVILEDGSNVLMKNLATGERIKSVVDGQIIYTEVKTFLKRYPTVFATYLAITTNTGQSLTLSDSHLVFVSSMNSTFNMEPRFAGTVKAGEYLFTPGNCPHDLCPSLVTGIEPIVKEGAYVPLTDAGTLVVNDVFASCYDSINHDLAHVLAAPARWFPWILTPWQDNGYSPIIPWVKYLSQLIFPNSVQFQGRQKATLAEMNTEL